MTLALKVVSDSARLLPPWDICLAPRGSKEFSGAEHLRGPSSAESHPLPLGHFSYRWRFQARVCTQMYVHPTLNMELDSPSLKILIASHYHTHPQSCPFYFSTALSCCWAPPRSSHPVAHTPTCGPGWSAISTPQLCLPDQPHAVSTSAPSLSISHPAVPG